MAAAGGGGGGAGGSAFGGISGLTSGIGGLAVKAAIALPVIRALAGGIASLGTVVASAAAGGAAVGAAGLGGLLTGIGGIAAVAIPASKAIKEAADAQKKYNEAVREYGRASKEAGAARDTMRGAYSGAPRGTRSLISEAQAFQRAWTNATKSGQEALVGFMRSVIATARRIRKPLADISNMVTRAFARQGERAANFLGSDRMLRGMRAGAGIFTENLGNVRRVGQAAAEMFSNVVRASRPFVKEFTNFMAKWFGARQRSTRNIKEMRNTIGKMVDDLKSIGKLGGAGIRLLLALMRGGGGAARREGRSMIGDFTDQLNRWTRWIERNPRKIQDFFRSTADGFRTLAGAIKDVIPLLTTVAEKLTPVIAGIGQLAGLANAGGAGGTFGALALAMGARGGFKNAGGMRTLITGRPPAGGGPAPPAPPVPVPGAARRVRRAADVSTC